MLAVLFAVSLQVPFFNEVIHLFSLFETEDMSRLSYFDQIRIFKFFIFRHDVKVSELGLFGFYADAYKELLSSVIGPLLS